MERGSEVTMWRFVVPVKKLKAQTLDEQCDYYLNKGYSIGTWLDGSLYAATNFPDKL